MSSTPRLTAEVVAPALFRAVRERDEAALAEIVERMTPWLAAEVRRAGARGGEVDEVVQDTWVAVIAAADEIGDDVRLLPWLATVARHRLVTLRRSDRRRERLHAAGGESVGVVPDVVALVRGREALLAVRHAVDNLPAPYRDVLRLHLFEGMAAHEIAQRLGIGRVGVRVRLFRGLRQLRRMLPDALALVLLAALTRRGVAQAPLWIGGAVLAAAATSVVLSPASAADATAPMVVAPVSVATEPPGMDRAAERPPQASQRVAVTLGRSLRVRVVDDLGSGIGGVGVRLGPPGGFDALLHDRLLATDDEGFVTFASVSTTASSVSCDRGVAAVVEASDQFVLLRVRGGMEVRGRVVDAVGTPIVDARVWLGGHGRAGLEGGEVASVRADGTFVLRGVAAGSALAIRADGHVGTVASTIERSDLGTIVLAQRAGSAAIEVVGPDGAPVVGAGLVLGRVEPELPGRLRPPPRQPPFLGHTDANGRCVLTGVAPGHVPLVVRAAGAAPASVMVRISPDVRASVQVRLAAGAMLRGRVVDGGGRGVAGARIACRCDSAFAAVDAIAAADGSFCLESLPTGDVGLLVWVPECDVVERVLALPPGETDVVVETVARRRRHGRLVDESDRPLVGWSVVLPLRNSRSVQANSTVAVTDARGELDCVVGPGADWSGMLIQPAGAIYWARVDDLLEDLPDGSFLVRATADLLATARASARVLTAEGAPLRLATIAVYDREGDRQMAGTTDQDGRFAYEALAVGEYRFVVEAPDRDVPTVELPVFQVEAGENKVLEVSAPATGQVAFEVRFADGSHPVDPQVSIVRRDSRCTHAVQRTAVGWQALVPGNYAITVQGFDCVARTEWFEVAAGMRTAIAMNVEPAVPHEFVFRGLPATDVGSEVTGVFVDAVRGVVVGSFRLAMDQAFPLPLTFMLPTGVFRCDITTATGKRLSATFESKGLVPTCDALRLDFQRVQ